ncbi:hypothetical protein QVD17_41877 [Tagetes erecta]|uniref:Uncharacterized protein n=1 Tax=Tagetes erecta TaxID=13708 RepID=A0AAD8NFV8_TARER|nr:hypothetical protein QVD17_41877 [Tagetes erecta]
MRSELEAGVLDGRGGCNKPAKPHPVIVRFGNEKPLGEHNVPAGTSVRSLSLTPSVTTQRNRIMILYALATTSPQEFAPHGFKTRHGREGFHLLIRHALLSFPTDVGCQSGGHQMHVWWKDGGMGKGGVG